MVKRLVQARNKVPLSDHEGLRLDIWICVNWFSFMSIFQEAGDDSIMSMQFMNKFQSFVQLYGRLVLNMSLCCTWNQTRISSIFLANECCVPSFPYLSSKSRLMRCMILTVSSFLPNLHFSCTPSKRYGSRPTATRATKRCFARFETFNFIDSADGTESAELR